MHHKILKLNIHINITLIIVFNIRWNVIFGDQKIRKKLNVQRMTNTFRCFPNMKISISTCKWVRILLLILYYLPYITRTHCWFIYFSDFYSIKPIRKLLPYYYSTQGMKYLHVWSNPNFKSMEKTWLPETLT
jgi:hypothetical protein